MVRVRERVHRFHDLRNSTLKHTLESVDKFFRESISSKIKMFVANMDSTNKAC